MALGVIGLTRGKSRGARGWLPLRDWHPFRFPGVLRGDGLAVGGHGCAGGLELFARGLVLNGALFIGVLLEIEEARITIELVPLIAGEADLGVGVRSVVLFGVGAGEVIRIEPRARVSLLAFERGKAVFVSFNEIEEKAEVVVEAVVVFGGWLEFSVEIDGRSISLKS